MYVLLARACSTKGRARGRGRGQPNSFVDRGEKMGERERKLMFSYIPMEVVACRIAASLVYGFTGIYSYY